jgi:hypothetical protein
MRCLKFGYKNTRPRLIIFPLVGIGLRWSAVVTIVIILNACVERFLILLTGSVYILFIRHSVLEI